MWGDDTDPDELQQAEPAPSREARARHNRNLFPEAAAFIDAVRAVYPSAAVIYFGPTREPLLPAEPEIDEDMRALERARRVQFTHA